jgi:hypothetical protein
MRAENREQRRRRDIMKRGMAFALALAAVLLSATAALADYSGGGLQAPRGQDSQAPRGQFSDYSGSDIQAPRG